MKKSERKTWASIILKHMLLKTEDEAKEEVEVVAEAEAEAEDTEEDLKAAGDLKTGEISQQIRLNATIVALRAT